MWFCCCLKLCMYVCTCCYTWKVHVAFVCIIFGCVSGFFSVSWLPNAQNGLWSFVGFLQDESGLNLFTGGEQEISSPCEDILTWIQRQVELLITQHQQWLSPVCSHLDTATGGAAHHTAPTVIVTSMFSPGYSNRWNSLSHFAWMFSSGYSDRWNMACDSERTFSLDTAAGGTSGHMTSTAITSSLCAHRSDQDWCLLQDFSGAKRQMFTLQQLFRRLPLVCMPSISLLKVLTSLPVPWF